MDKTKLAAWYDAHIAAAWYRSASLIVGWLLSAGVFLPDLLDFVANHWDLIGGAVLPKLDASTKAIILAVYIAFIAPPLRAWRQNKMQAAALKQAAQTGVISTRRGSDALLVAVPGTNPVIVRAEDQEAGTRLATPGPTMEEFAAEQEARLKVPNEFDELIKHRTTTGL